MSSTASNIQKLLSGVSAFSGLSSEDLYWLSERCTPFTCAVGQSLLLNDRLPEYCYVIVEGKGRVLHQDPSVKRPLTLAYSNPGDLVGWAGLIRRSPCEWITAATSLKLLAFTADTFYQLVERSLSFSSWLETTNSPSELITVLEPSLRKRPIAYPHERDVLRKLLPSMKVVTSHDECLRHLDDGAVWLWNAQAPSYSVPCGEYVNPLSFHKFPSSTSPRLLRIDRNAWTEIISPNLVPPETKAVVDTNSIWSNDRYSDLLAPQPEGERLETPAFSNAIPASRNLSWKGKRLPVVSGIGATGQSLACLEMLCLFYNVPFRRDVLSKACQESFSNKSITLESFGNISTLVGFVGSISYYPSVQLFRLPFPCFDPLLY